MTYSPEWSAIYDAGEMRGGQSSELLILLHDFGKVYKDSNVNALELGCGLAANYPLFKLNGFSYFGVDGSASAVDRALEAFPELTGHILQADFTATQFAPAFFGIVADRAAISHNDTQSVKRCVAHIHDILLTNGMFVGVDWFSTKHSEFWRGERVDEYTRTGYTDGQFANVGKVHFSSQESLKELFADFHIVMLRERLTHIPAGYPDGGYQMKFKAPFYDGKDYHSAVWDILAVKR